MRLKLWLIIGVAFMVVGCATPYLGMSRHDFLTTTGIAVWVDRITPQDIVYYDQGGLFYYFVNDRLVRMDRGELKQLRVQQEIINR